MNSRTLIYVESILRQIFSAFFAKTPIEIMQSTAYWLRVSRDCCTANHRLSHQHEKRESQVMHISRDLEKDGFISS